MTDLSVADTIAEQLGGTGKLTAMISAKHFVGDDTSLQFRFGTGARNDANSVQITLSPNDTYTVRFCRIGRAPRFDILECGTTEGLHAGDLRPHFERATGFYLSL
jgi:hypothetical protein